MLFRVQSAAVYGINAYPVYVEVDLSTGEKLEFKTVGLPDAAIRESQQRVRAALRNCGFDLPRKNITINLAPANLKKEGSAFDLPMAVGILGASGCVHVQDLSLFLFMGELALDGSVRSVKGALPMACMARDRGMQSVVLPEMNVAEASIVEGICALPVRSLREVVSMLNGETPWASHPIDRDSLLTGRGGCGVDLEDVKGQFQAKRAMEVAVAGNHNILMIGPPGSGKTMLARRLPTILPPMTFEEAIESTKIHSVAGLLPDTPGLIGTRPFRAPHHTISNAGLIGGGAIPRPGEVSLAHNGVLFLDEFPEFHRNVLDMLRQPLEDEKVTIARAAGVLTFPARFMLSAAMNPCPCGYLGDPYHECLCTPHQVLRYRARISGPLLDRIDLHIPVSAVKYPELVQRGKSEDSQTVRIRVLEARDTQRKRFAGDGVFCNAQMPPSLLRRYCNLDGASERRMEQAITRLGLSARAYDRILRVSRTLADLEHCEKIADRHVAEAIHYRSFDRPLNRTEIQRDCLYSGLP